MGRLHRQLLRHIYANGRVLDDLLDAPFDFACGCCKMGEQIAYVRGESGVGCLDGLDRLPRQYLSRSTSSIGFLPVDPVDMAENFNAR